MYNLHLSSQQTPARFLAALLLLSLLAACSSVPQKSSPYRESNRNKNYFDSRDNTIDLLVSLKEAEQRANETGRKILVAGRQMAVEKEEVVRGSCWDFIHAVYNRAGYPNDRTSRVTVFKGTKEKGPYANTRLIQPGDWLYYVNHSYNGIEHSGIFVKWLDPASRNALVLSYGGEKRNETARYLPFDLSNVYNIIRPAHKSGDAPQKLSSRAEKGTP